VAGDWGAWPGTCSRRGAGRFRVGSQRRRPGVPGKCAGIVGPGRWSTKARGVWWGHRGGHITQCSFRAPTRPWSSVVLSSLWPRGHDARAACTRLFAMSRLVGAPFIFYLTGGWDGVGGRFLWPAVSVAANEHWLVSVAVNGERLLGWSGMGERGRGAEGDVRVQSSTVEYNTGTVRYGVVQYRDGTALSQGPEWPKKCLSWNRPFLKALNGPKSVSVGTVPFSRP
jgi:hypothetical protein